MGEGEKDILFIFLTRIYFGKKNSIFERRQWHNGMAVTRRFVHILNYVKIVYFKSKVLLFAQRKSSLLHCKFVSNLSGFDIRFPFWLSCIFYVFQLFSLFWGVWMRSLIFEPLFSLNRPLMLFARRKLRSSWLKTFLVARFPPRAAWRLPRRPWTAAVAKRP